MPGLLRGVARAAVVSGTATAVSNRVSRRQGEKWAQQGQAAPAYMLAEPAAGPGYAQGEPAAPPPAAADPIEQLKELAELHSQGILTDEEFAAQKAKILG